MCRKHKDDELDGVPRDKFNLVYVIIFCAGIGSLLPWNFFITAIDYFQDKLGDKNAPPDAPLTKEQSLFGNYLSLCSLLPLAVFMIINLLIMNYISAFVRFTIGSCVVFVMFIVTVVLVKVETSPSVFLGLTLGSVVFINCGSALFQGSILGITSSLPTRNMKAFMEGQAFAGVLAAVAQIISIAASTDKTASALGYFLFALIFLAIATVLTHLLKLNAYFKYYWSGQNGKLDDEYNKMDEDDIRSRFESKKPNVFRGLWNSVKDVWLHGLCALLALMITLSIFPALLQSIKSQSSNRTWADKYFTPVIVFLSYNVFDWVGRTLAGIIKWPKENQKWILFGFALSRIALIPFVLFMNQDATKLARTFTHDAFPIIWVILLGLTNGYFLSLAMMYGPRFVKRGTSEGAGLVLSIFLALGLSLGSAVSAILALILRP